MRRVFPMAPAKVDSIGNATKDGSQSIALAQAKT
jgi:hypothetical protein